jgi:peptidoglycan/LPS O-acetylase OafA/YrhL
MRILKLDGLRGVFSLMVVFFHYDIRLLPNFLGDNFIIRQSWIFVEFFFVLSGFLIANNYYNIITFKHLKIFIYKRFIRLYPLLLFSTLIFLFSKVFFNSFFQNHINSPESISSLIYKTIDTLFLTNSTPFFGNSHGMNGPSWSISSEMISYLIFGIIIYISKPKYRLWIFGFIIILSGLLQVIFKDLDLDFSFLRGTLSFSLGVLLYKINLIKLNVSNYFELMIPLIVLYFMYFINSDSSQNIFYRIVIINLVFFFSIFILLKTNGIISIILEKTFFQFLGRISYSIYLNHLIVITLFSRFIFSLIKIDQSILNQLFVFITCIVITLLYSNLTYTQIELRAGSFLKNKILN